MKAFYSAKPLEFHLDTPAETLIQGQSIAGEFTATNRGDAPASAQGFAVALSYAEFRSVRDRPERAFRKRDERELGKDIALDPGESFRAKWEFALPRDCPITSKSGAMFLLYGNRLGEAGGYGMLDLRINPLPVLEIFIATVENLFSFQCLGRKHHDGFMEVRFKPPESFPSLEKFQILMRYREAAGLELVFEAKVKGFDREGKSGLKTRDVKFERTLPPEQAIPGGRLPNRTLFKQSFEEALTEIVPSFMKRE